MASRAPFADGDFQPRLVRRKSRSRRGAAFLSDLVMCSPAMERVASLAYRAARCTLPLLIEGEPGVGKERLARAIDAARATRNRPFTLVDCARLSAGELDDLLVIQARRLRDRPNHRPRNRSAASPGTLFLRHVGVLTDAAQELLLEILDSFGSRNKSADERPSIRVIAATEGRLVDLVARGTFRQDLFQRLNVLPIWIPPLRDRRSDIPELARSFLAEAAAEPGGAPVEISQEALALLVTQDWPGNVSQLRAALLGAVASAPGSKLVPEVLERVLPAWRRSPSAMGTRKPAVESPARSAVAGARQNIEDRALGAESLPDTFRPARYGVARLLDESGELRRFEALEAEVIRFAVDHCRGRMSEVARRLGIGRSTLYRKLKDYGIASGAVGAP